MGADFNNTVCGMPIISVSVPENLLERVQNSIREQGFANRSEIIRQALRALVLESRNLRELEGEIAASVTIIYKRGAKNRQISEVDFQLFDIVLLFPPDPLPPQLDS